MKFLIYVQLYLDLSGRIFGCFADDYYFSIHEQNILYVVKLKTCPVYKS